MHSDYAGLFYVPRKRQGPLHLQGVGRPGGDLTLEWISITGLVCQGEVTMEGEEWEEVRREQKQVGFMGGCNVVYHTGVQI